MNRGEVMGVVRALEEEAGHPETDIRWRQKSFLRGRVGELDTRLPRLNPHQAMLV